MSLDEYEDCAACRLSEMTGRPHEEFEPDAEIPDLEEQGYCIPDGGHAESERNVYRTEIQCEDCLGWFEATFEDPSESFTASCPKCGAFYPELYV